MLKVKDNVDLKELEKFGFEEELYYYVLDSYNGLYDGEYYRIEKENPIIEISVDCDERCYKLDNTIYDLIQDGLVEKVEDK